MGSIHFVYSLWKPFIEKYVIESQHGMVKIFSKVDSFVTHHRLVFLVIIPDCKTVTLLNATIEKRRVTRNTIVFILFMELE